MTNISETSIEPSSCGTKPRTKPFFLCELAVGKKDKLGNKVEEILWLARNYAVYRSHRGVHVHFSDCAREEDDQRN